jgi:ubiquinone/menaquinone biosynthesis C-methylase UbiE
LLYWEFIIAEGAHLGPRVVVWLYDLVAHRYNQIKKFEPEIEADLVGWPLTEALVEIEQSRVLDVAAGNGRVARAVMRQIAFDGSVTSLDLSAGMVAEGQRECAQWVDRVQWLRGPADSLPFAAETFDAVTCLEALEFLPDARAALHEWVRVLRVGGVLVVTNRVGGEARLIVGKTFRREAFVKILEQLPLEEVRVEAWQVEYDLAWGRKVVGRRQ